MRILCYILVVLFATTSAVGQQINPVPDYIFRNSMSVGRNAPTDTSAYFSIGPRFGATRGFMPPMVVDTAAVTGTKRNGLLIYSIQRNSFLYWDSTGMRWSRIAANLDTLLLSTRAWRQKGIDSLASVRIGGSGVTGYIPKFTAARTLDSSQIFQQGGNIGIGTASPGGVFKLVVSGADASINGLRFGIGAANVNSNVAIGNGVMDSATASATSNVAIGNGAGRRIKSGIRSTYVGAESGLNADAGNNTTLGWRAFNKATTANQNTAIGTEALNEMLVGDRNIAIGVGSLFAIQNTSENIGIGQNAGRWIGPGSTNVADSIRQSVYIGNDSRTGSKTSQNEIVIGYGVTGLGSNSVVLGNSSITNTYLRGKTLVNTITDAGYQLDVAGNIRSTTDAYFNTTSGETYIGTTSDAGAFKLQVNGVARASDGLATGNPNGGTAATWKLGIVVAGSYTAASNYLQVDVGGTLYYIGLVTPN